MAQMRNHFKDAPAVFFNDAGEAVDVGDFYGVSNTLTENILAVFGLWLFWIGVAYITMKYVRHQKR